MEVDLEGRQTLQGPKEDFEGRDGIIVRYAIPFDLMKWHFLRQGQNVFFFSGSEVTSSPEGPKHSKKGQTDRETCQERAHTVVELKYFLCIFDI